jgi:hypothetical protein
MSPEEVRQLARDELASNPPPPIPPGAMRRIRDIFNAHEKSLLYVETQSA